jgi:hypothetical protein
MEASQIILPAFAGSNLHLVFEMIWLALEKPLSDGAEVAGTAKYTLASLEKWIMCFHTASAA